MSRFYFSEEFLEDVENLSSTIKGQIPALYLRLPMNKN